ncbi:nucleotide exchange factor GrpE [Actinocorallia sp. A-T 12471]|uniref:nucleotide exchange factor GrpE n=1 Tax=Actinocorallia sp. A-T 12471 TaxID=3089813 RepID=UPI0029CBF632|nr:nucleotide exchange factor GrpE [Actinocorallia sp. A-T 12471]MDX6741952.1 nucleotide exchange factor GrpE [Actinocorallia sp. A-T 12471]
MSSSQEEPVIRDSRRIDPETGELRTPSEQEESAAPADEAVDESSAELREQLEERTRDLQRLQAEYVNYRKRVERDRVAVREQAIAGVLTDLLPILDSVDKAREHDELVGAFKSVGESLETTLGKLGLERYGAVGDPFDPNVHEALTHVPSADVEEESVLEVYQPGYRIGERVVRPARVVVAGPQT